jgi:hypothetical protein
LRKYLDCNNSEPHSEQRRMVWTEKYAYNYIVLSRDSPDWLRAGRLRGRGSSPGRVKNFHFSMSSRPALGSTQPPIQWSPGALSRG